jgi:hypothetical protein
VAKWRKEEEKIRKELKDAKSIEKAKKTKRVTLKRIGKYAEAEEVVYAAFKESRAKGKRVSGRWLRSRMRVTLKQLDPLTHFEFRASKKWLVNFSNRYNIALRKRTNIKSTSVEERIPIMRQWHARLRQRLRRGPQLSEKWGRWLPHQRWNVDQVPCALNPGKEYTYEEKGAKRIWIASRKNGDDKWAVSGQHEGWNFC